jgi:hypothetical protein
MGKSVETKSGLVACLGLEIVRVTTKKHRVSFLGEENGLKLDCSEGRITL